MDTALAPATAERPWRLYRLRNSVPNEWWVIAPDEESAIAWSVARRRVRRAENIRRVADQTEHWVAQSIAFQSKSDLVQVLATATQVGQGSFTIACPEIGRYINEWHVTP